MTTTSEIDWDRYTLLSKHLLARSLLSIEASLGLAYNTIDAYARGREDFFRFCSKHSVVPESASKEQIALWVQDLTSRPHGSGSNIKILDSGAGLSNATLQQRVTSVRLFFDYVIEKGQRTDNPIGRGRYTPGKGYAGRKDRALVPRHKKLPWIPNEEQWQAILFSLKTEPPRNRAMFILGYDAPLRRGELCSLTINDFDFAHRLLTIRPEAAKRWSGRVVPFSASAAALLSGYLRHRRGLSIKPGPLFLSESRRNFAEPLTFWTWSKIIRQLAKRAGVERLTTHTLRHLSLTDLARAGWDILEIAKFAGHRDTRTTMDYIHLSGRELAQKIERGMDQIHQWRLRVMAETLS